MTFRFLLLIITAFASLNGLAQSYSFLSYSIAEGLPQSQVTAITEDEEGYLWVGTLGGLGRFNGSSFVNFSTRDGLLNNRITSVSFVNKKLWVGHQGGISMISKGKVIKKWPFAEEDNNLNVGAVQYFENQYVVATNGNGLYIIDSRHNMRNVHLGPSGNEDRIRGLAVSGKELYIATRAGLMKTSDLVHFQLVKGGENLNVSGLTKSGDKLYFTTFDRKFKEDDPEPGIPGGFFSFDLKSRKITNLATVAIGTVIRNCIVDTQQENVWAPSYNGIFILSRDGRLRSIDQEKGLPLNKLSTIFEDRNGTIWVGSEGKGLFRFPGEQFKYFKRNENSKTGIKTDLIVSALEINPNRYVFGSFDNNGLMEYLQNSRFETTEIPGTLWALEKDRLGNIWIGTDDGLIQYLPNRQLKTYRSQDGTPGDKITTFYKDGNDIWVGGSDGLSRIVNGKIARVNKSSSQNIDVGTIRNIIRYKKTIYCAADGGLFAFVNGRYKPVPGIPKKAVALETDAHGNLWVGTEEGFFWSDGTHAQQIFFSNQTASSFINFINIDNSTDKVFVGTGNGLYVLSNLELKEKAKYKHYGLEDGLISLESNINSGYIDHKGRLWFGTSQGLTVFDPAAELFDFGKVMPYLNVKSLKLNMQDFNYADYSTRFNAYGIPLNLVLPRSKNNLLIELDGVTLKNSKDLKFQYWLEGMDENWSPAFSNPQVTLSNIPPGKYNLHIRAVNATGGFSNEYVLFINIAPAFYATWWFFCLVFVFIVALTILIIQIRVRRERAKSYQETLEFRARLSSLEQQSLNASMNRHFIFNSLNSIQYFINTQDRISANRYLTNFAKLIRKNLDSSSEDNNMVSLSQEIERLELYLSLESMRFRDRFDYKIEVSDIETESIMVPAMLFQPFVENSIIHGILPVEDRKGMISIKIEAKGDHLDVILEDNGIGIDNSMNKKRQENGDHKSQGMEITSKRIELLKKLSNKNFEMEGPYQIENKDRSISGTRVLLKIPCENLEEED